jgi:hypothetical protein
VKYNHLVDKCDIGKAQQGQALARLQTAIAQNISFEREISSKIRKVYDRASSQDFQRAQVALAEGLRQSERLGDMLVAMDARVSEKQTKVDRIKVVAPTKGKKKPLIGN